jgi:hypothetical protein
MPRLAAVKLWRPRVKICGAAALVEPPMSSHGRSGGALIRPQHRNLMSNKNHNCNGRRRVEANCPGGFQIDDGLEFALLLHRQIGWPLSDLPS